MDPAVAEVVGISREFSTFSECVSLGNDVMDCNGL